MLLGDRSNSTPEPEGVSDKGCLFLGRGRDWIRAYAGMTEGSGNDGVRFVRSQTVVGPLLKHSAMVPLPDGNA